MKLATYQDGSRDGQLVVVSRDLSTAHYAAGIVNHLQQALDDWNFVSPQLQDLYEALNQGKVRHAFPFDPERCMAPLPRAYLWAQGTAYLNHARLLHSGAELPEHRLQTPQIQIGSSDPLWGACDSITLDDESGEVDFAAGLAVIAGDVPRGTDAEQALESIRLVMLANTFTLQSNEQSVPFATTFSPVAVTLDELGEAWQQGRLHLTLQSTWNGRKLGLCETGPEMDFHFGQLIHQLCALKPLHAGAIIGSGTVSNASVNDAQGRQHWPKGHQCIAEKRAVETLQDGQPNTGFMKVGDTLRIDMKDRLGQSLFGTIDSRLDLIQR